MKKVENFYSVKVGYVIIVLILKKEGLKKVLNFPQPPSDASVKVT